MGECKPSHADADDMGPEQMRGALRELVGDMYASSSRGPRDALFRIWSKFHDKWFGPDVNVLPITKEKLLKVSSLFKTGGYRTVKNYLSRVKEHHISAGYNWNDRLDLISTKSARSVLRGFGGAHRSEAVELTSTIEALQDTIDPIP